MERVLDDLRYAVRKLRKAPGFATAAILSIAIGIGANSAIFSVANTLLLRPSPITEPDRVVDVYATFSTDDGLHTFSYPNYVDYRDRTRTLSGLAAFDHLMVSMNTGDAPELVFAAVATHDYFDVLGIEPALGRFFLPEEDATPGSHPLAVISHGLWQRRFAGDADVLGREITLNGTRFAVVGVAPPSFTSTQAFTAPDVWTPMMMWSELRSSPRFLTSRSSLALQLVGRLAPGATIEQAQTELGTIARALEEEFPDVNEGRSVLAVKSSALPPEARRVVGGFMALLLVVTGLVLLVACVNVGNLLLARAIGRRREIAVRLAVGAGRGRIVRQLVTETLVLFAVAGIAGILLGLWTTKLLPALLPPIDVPISLDFALDIRVLSFAAALTLLTGLIFGLVPALGSSRPDLVPALKDDEGSGRYSKSRLRGALVVGQVAISLLLLVGAGLFLRALQRADGIDPGFNPDGLAVASLDLDMHGYSVERGREFFERLRERMENLPAVESATLVDPPPLSLSRRTMSVLVPGHEPPQGLAGFPIDVSVVAPDYFRSMAIQLLQGRDFDERLTADVPARAVINEMMARRFWRDGSPVGRRFYVDSIVDSLSVEVIGVARDSKYRTLGEEPQMFIYLPLAQFYQGDMWVVARARADVTPILSAIRGEVRALDPNMSLAVVMPLRQLVGVSLLPQRVAAWVTGVVGLIGLLLAGVGLYGVTAFAVSQRTREFGIRIALGASEGDVVGLVLRRGAVLTAWGLAIGLLLAFVVTRFLAGLLFGVSALDPVAFAGVAILLAGVAAAASYIPARRAAAVDAMESLRYE